MPGSRYLRGAVALAGAVASAALVASCSSSSKSPNAEETTKAVASESFHGLTVKEATNLEGVLPLERGVQSDVYYPETKVLTVTFTSTAVLLDQRNVENLVRQAKQGATVPTPTPTHSSTPTPTHSYPSPPPFSSGPTPPPRGSPHPKHRGD